MAAYLPQGNKGFTVIEVMIVLVIAAVILLIMFLAVPALQRNTRNTQRKSDIARTSTAFLEYLAASNPMPTGKAAANQALAAEIKQTANADTLKQLQIDDSTGLAGSSSATWDIAVMRTRSRCNEEGDNVNGSLSTGRVAIIYWLETGGDMQRYCHQVQ